MPEFEFAVFQTVKRRRLVTVEASDSDEAARLVQQGAGEVREWSSRRPAEVLDTEIEFEIIDGPDEPANDS